jgi:hypothetical protein
MAKLESSPPTDDLSYASNLARVGLDAQAAKCRGPGVTCPLFYNPGSDVVERVSPDVGL